MQMRSISIDKNEATIFVSRNKTWTMRDRLFFWLLGKNKKLEQCRDACVLFPSKMTLQPCVYSCKHTRIPTLSVAPSARKEKASAVRAAKSLNPIISFRSCLNTPGEREREWSEVFLKRRHTVMHLRHPTVPVIENYRSIFKWMNSLIEHDSCWTKAS